MKKPYKMPNGQEVMGEEVEFETEREAFNSYVLADGTRLRVKFVVAQVVRMEAYGPDGNPLYMVNFGQVMSADVPEQLKKR